MTQFTAQHTPSTPVTGNGLRPGTATARALSLQCLWLAGHVTTPHMSAYKHHTLPVLPLARPHAPDHQHAHSRACTDWMNRLRLHPNIASS